MKMSKICKWGLMVGFVASLGACTSSVSSDDYDDMDRSSSSGKSSVSGDATCKSVKVTLPAPTNFSVTKDNDSTWTLTWDYSRDESRAETGFEIEALDLEASSPEWVTEGTTKADVTIYKLKGSKKAGKYYRVFAKDDCGYSKESNRLQITSDGNSVVDTDSSTVESSASAIPTDLTISRIAPGIWDLSWSYSDATEDPDRKFIIQTSKLKDFKWTSLKYPIEGNVRHYYIQGRDKIETYYRMAVVNGSDTSSFTDAIQLTPDIEYRDYMALNTPSPSSQITLTYTTGFEADKDTSSEDKTYIEAWATYTITENFISKYIVESEYTDTVYYEARWFTSLENYNYYKGNCEGKKKSDKCDSCYWSETFPYQEPSISKRFSAYDDFADAAKKKTIFEDCAAQSGYTTENHAKLYSSTTDPDEWKTIAANEANMAICLQSYLHGICGYYVQIRIVWKDNTNGKGKGETDWSEWTQPYNIRDISGADKICDQ